MGERRDGGEQLGLDVLPGDEQVGGLDPGGERRVDQVLALADEQPELRPADACSPAAGSASAGGSGEVIIAQQLTARAARVLRWCR